MDDRLLTAIRMLQEVLDSQPTAYGWYLGDLGHLQKDGRTSGQLSFCIYERQTAVDQKTWSTHIAGTDLQQMILQGIVNLEEHLAQQEADIKATLAKLKESE